MHVLITGGAGFIGSTLVDASLARGDKVTVVDNFTNGRVDNLAAAQSKATGSLRVLRMDVRDPGLKDVLAERVPEVVYHLAAQIDVRASVLDPHQDASINVLGTIAVARAAIAAGVRKIVFASSGGSIYGESPNLPIPETAAVEPLSPYAVSKVAAELYLNSFSRLHGLQCTHLAFANVYGPRQDPGGEAGVVSIFTQALLAGTPTRLFGDGGNTRDYVHVSDVARALTLAAGDIGDRQRFNIGTGVQTSDRELHTLIARAVGCPDRPVPAPARPGDLRHSSIDCSLARSVLGWVPTYQLPAGIADTVMSFRSP